MATKPLTLTTEQLKEHPELVAIDGVLYDIAGFAPHHPGGDHIQGAGAYDASALYASMHPGQLADKSELLQKYRMGTHIRGKEDVIYRYDSPFAQDLLKTVRASMKKSWMAPVGFYLRILAIACATLYCEWNFIVSGTILSACLVGLCHAQIGLSVQHDASHGAISKNFSVNNFFAYGADWIGSSKWIWFQQHILWHHPHTNHPEYDPDATSAEPLVKFQPHGDAKWFHKFQQLYLYVALSFYGPSIVYNLFPILFMKHNDHVSSAVGKTSYMSNEKVLAFAMRIFYGLRLVLAPWLVSGASPLIGMFFPNFVTGVLLTAVFVVSHNFEGSDRDPAHTIKNDGNAQEPICWYKAQAETSCTYGGTIGMLLTGGLNLQIEHHLFPRLSSWYYPSIREDIRACCKRHGVRYVYFPTLFHNVANMLTYVRKVGVSAALKATHAH